MSSLTVTITGDSSSLNTYFHPEINLDDGHSYSCCLLDFYSYNSIPNISRKNNKFYYSYMRNELVDMNVITIPVGSYEIDEIIEYLHSEFAKKKVNIEIEANKNTLKCKIKNKTDAIIDFTRSDCIGSVLGFSKRLLKNGDSKSDKLVNIQNINNLRIDCDLTSGSFHNGKNTHTIYEFNPKVDPGYKINEQPKHLIYLPVIRRRVNTVNISIVDQDGELVDFRGEQITCRLHIKRDI